MKLSKGEVISIIITVLFVAGACVAAATGSLAGGGASVALSEITSAPAPIAAAPEAAALININTATAQELDALPEIGEKTAQAIVEWREQHGAFEHITDIMDVTGIGSATFEELKTLITV